mmetsp:Transcript_4893/g.10982  ORF Transcript_4893/g.10982 Transcript_4893/m.10982 type:complete len:80 (-) Transcript_4893:153-392(-)
MLLDLSSHKRRKVAVNSSNSNHRYGQIKVNSLPSSKSGQPQENNSIYEELVVFMFGKSGALHVTCHKRDEPSDMSPKQW